MIDLRKQFAGSGYLIVDSPHDTTNVVCRYGHVYADGDSLMASLDCNSPVLARALRKLGPAVMDGSFEELTIRFPASRIRDVTRILRPRQAIVSKRAA